jgi:23S rRNA pseudouridine1911/1915/1917 synthase
MAILKSNGRPAKTSFRVLKRFHKTGVSLLSITLHTGRTHQARVHLASEKLPVIGDSVYGNGNKELFKSFPSLKPLVTRQLLHARRLMVPDPKNTADLKFSSPWPADFVEMYKELLRLEDM